MNFITQHSRLLALTATAFLTLTGNTFASAPARAVPKLMPEASERQSLTVMSYNIEGLPPPARFGRASSLERIGEQLADLREQGREPNIVLLQEAFAAPAKHIAETAGYRYVADGPSEEDLNTQPPPAAAATFVSGQSHLKGEDDGKWTDSGLRILSDYPIINVQRLAFPEWACAGYDCLANKGVLIAWVAIPGHAQPVPFIDTHLNSRAASGVSTSRADIAYAYQVAALRAFVSRNVPASSPAFLGGDFNSGQASVRWADLKEGVLTGGRNSLLEALGESRAIPEDERADSEAVLHRAKDWLFYRGSSRSPIVLTGFEVPFGHQSDGSTLSDHMGYEARYRFGKSTTV